MNTGDDMGLQRTDARVLADADTYNRTYRKLRSELWGQGIHSLKSKRAHAAADRARIRPDYSDVRVARAARAEQGRA